MTICPQCKKVIGPSAPAYKASRGFLAEDGSYYEDESVVFHKECYHSFDAFAEVEYRIENN